MNSEVKVKGSGKGPFKSRLNLFLVIFIVAALLGTAVYATALENQVTNLTLYPDPMRLGSSLSIKFNLGTSSNVSIKVYDEAGQLIRTIWDNIFRQTNSYSLSWDGKNQSGVVVPNGYYKITVEAKDTAGTQLGYAEKTIKAAKAPVVSSVTDAPDPFDPVNGEQAAIKYTISTDAMVTVSILKDYTVVRTIVSNVPQTGGAQTIYWDGKDDLGNLVDDRTYIYQIDAVSPFEASFKHTYKSYTTVEKEAPRIFNFSATPDPVRLSQSYLSIKFDLSEDANATVKILDNSGAVIRTVWDNVARRAGTSGVSWDGKNDAGSYVPEGTYTVSVSAVDKYGKASGEQQASVVAGYMPTISGFSASPDMFNPEDPASSLISYKVSSDALVTVEIVNGYDKVRTLTNQALQPGGVTQEVYWDGRNDAGVIVGDADYTVQITAVSQVVSSFTSTYRGTVIVEKGAPGITGFTVSQEPYRLGTTSLSIQYNLTENATVDVNIYRGDVLIKELVKGVARNAGPNGTSWDGKDSTGAPVPEGIYTITINAVDRYGKSDQAQNNVTCGYQPVITSVSSAPEPFDYQDSVDAAVYFNLSNDAKVNLIILQGSTTIRTVAAGVLPAGSQYVAWDGRDDAGNLVKDGPYAFEVVATSPTVDAFKTTARGTVTVEAKNPELTGLTVSPSIVKVGSNASFGYTLSEPATVTVQVVKADGTVVRDLPAQNRTYAGSYNTGWDSKDNFGNDITTGDYIVKISAVDKFNKTASAQLPFKASAPPVISNVFADPAAFAAGTSTAINFTVSEDSNITIRMYDSAGTAIKTVCSYLQVPAGPNSVLWDGKNNTGTVMEGVYSFKIDAISILGNYKGLQASGTVEVTPGTGGGTPQSCTDCHTNYPTVHPMANCNGCHAGEEPITSIHHDPNYRCQDCHGGHGTDANVLRPYECTFCHNDNFSYKIPYHPGDMNVLHTAPLNADCQKCHQASLNVEHPLHNDDLGQPYDCNSCHQSTVAEVVYAIDNGQKNCDACHTSVSGHEEMHTPTGIQADCTKCHKDSLTQEHLDNPTTQTGNTWTCGTCHDSTVTEVVDAISSNDRNCSACHTQANHQTVHETTNLDANCTTCHNNNLVDEHMNNTTTQTGNSWSCDTCHQSTKPEVTWAIASGNEQCAACHQTGHNVNFVEKVPADIPLYAGYEWTQPIDASIFAGESWMPDEFTTAGKVVVSNRRTDVSGEAVYIFYNNQMAANGWTVQPHTLEISDFFSLEFTKGNRKAIVWFYGGAGHTASPVLPAGYRVEVIYK